LPKPGRAVLALLPPLVRDVLDRSQHRLAHQAETVIRCVRMLARLVQVDAGLIGYHRGEAAKSLGWLNAEPYRSQVAGVDPALLARL
jgi:hypothetical protein